MYLYLMKVSLSPDIILCGWLGLKHQLTNSSFSWISIATHILIVPDVPTFPVESDPETVLPIETSADFTVLPWGSLRIHRASREHVGMYTCSHAHSSVSVSSKLIILGKLLGEFFAVSGKSSVLRQCCAGWFSVGWVLGEGPVGWGVLFGWVVLD